jgi:hypothetical protein
MTHITEVVAEEEKLCFGCKGVHRDLVDRELRGVRPKA